MRNPFSFALCGRTARSFACGQPQPFSVFGSLITRMALPFVAILVLGAGPLEVAARPRPSTSGPGLIVGLVAGAWVDRLRRRPVLVWADLGRAVLLATIPIAAVGRRG